MAENQSSSGLTLMARAGRAMSRWSVGTAVAAGLAPAAMLSPVALAGPTGETVVIGDVTFTREGNNVYITASDGSVITYDSFNLTADEMVRFFQPGSDARVYNQILGAMPSTINGSIFANGIVYFVNPAGVIFGPNAVINVGSIYAAAANLSHADFIAGRDHFTNAGGAVVNQGTIVGSRIHMLGNQVTNHGSLRADGGMVMMAAGKDFLISPDGSGVMVHVDGRNAALGPSAGASKPGMGSQAGVLNTGWIDANGGTAILAAGDLYSLGIHNLGTINASGGSVLLSAQDGAVVNDGSLDVSAEGDAGSVIVRGPSVVNRGEVRADSAHGKAGYAELTSQNHTLLIGKSVVSAAGGSADALGGEILIHSYNGYSLLSGKASLSVSGGAGGGFAEFSGRYMNLFGSISLGSSHGKAGTLLIDPWDLRIVETISGSDNSLVFPDDPFDNGDVTISFNEGDDKVDDVNVIDAASIEALDGTILLEAINDLTLETGLQFTNGQSLEMRAGRHLTLNGLITGLSSLTLLADFGFDGYVFPANLNDASVGVKDESTDNGIGDLIWNVAGAVDGLDSLTLGGTNITIGALDFTNLGGPVAITAAGNVSLGGSMAFSTPSSLTATADGNIVLNTTVTGASSIVLTADADSSGAGDVTLSLTGPQTFTGAFGASGVNINLDNSVTSITSEGLALNGNLTTGATTLTLDAGGGALELGNLTATAATAVVLSGDSLTASGTISADVGTLDIQTGGTVGGSVGAAGDLTIAGDLDVTGSVGSGGTINAGGDLLAGGAMLAGGAIDITGDAAAGADITAGTTLDIGGTLTLSGVGAQSIEAGGQATFGGDVAKANGDLSIEAGLGGAGTLDFNGGVTATNGALTLLSDATVAGDLASGTNLTLGTGITLDGTGSQSLSSGGILTVSQSITKANGDLALNGATGVDVDAAITLSNGAFSSSGGYFDNTGFAISASSITLTHSDGVTIGGNLFGGGSVDLHAGDDGTGNLAILGVAVRGDSVSLRAGDGLNGGGTTALITLDPTATFASGNGATGPGTFVFRQDASIDTTADGPTATMVQGGTLGASYTLSSDDGSVFVANGNLAEGVDFTVNAATTITLNSNLNVNTLTADSGGLTSVLGQVTSAGAVALLGDASVQAGMTSGSTMTFGGATTVSAAVSATGAMTFQGTANIQTSLNTTGSVSFEDAATIAGNLSSGGFVDFQGSAVFSGFFDQTVTGASVQLASGASKNSGSLTINAVGVTIGDQVNIANGGFNTSGGVATTDDILTTGLVNIGGSLAVTSGAQVTVSGTSVAVAGDTSATTGGLLVQAASFSTAGLSTTGGGDVTLTGSGTVNAPINVTGGMNVNGSLAMNGAAATVGTVDGLTVGGNLTRNGGDLAVTGSLALGGSLIGSNAVTLNGPVTLTNDLANQAIVASGTLTLNNTVTKSGARLDLSGSSIAGSTGSVQSTGGDLFFTGQTTLANAAIVASGGIQFANDASVASVQSTGLYVWAQGGLTTTGAISAADVVEVDGVLNAGQNVTAGNGLFTFSAATVQGDITGDLVNAFSSLTVNGNVNVTNTFLVSSTANLGGNVTAGTIALQGATNLTGNGTQTLAADTITSLGVTKNQGSLNINATTLALLSGNLSVGNGGLTVTGPTRLGANNSLVTASGPVNFTGSLIIDSNTLMTSTGGAALTLGGPVTDNGVGAILTLNTSGLTTLGSTVNTGQLITDAGGSTSINGAVTTSGQQNYQDQLALGADAALTSTGGGNLILAQGVTGNQSLSTSTSGTTAMGGEVNVASWTTSALGNTTLGSDVTASGAIAIANALDLTSSVLLDGGSVSLTGGVSGSGQDLGIVSGGLTDLRGTIAVNSLTTDVAGTLQVGADITTDEGFTFGESAVLLVGNSTLRDNFNGGIELSNSFSGPFSLVIQSAGDLRVTGGTYTQLSSLAFESAANVLMQAQLGTALSRLGTLSIRSGDLGVDPLQPGTITLDNGGSAIEIFTTGDVLFNAGGHSLVPQLATIGASGDLTISSTTGDFIMGQNEKLTVLGTLDVALSFGGGFSSRAVLGDITTLGDMIITADGISVLARLGEVLLAENPNVPGLIEAGEDPDSGVDFVTGGQFVWSVTPTVLNGGSSSVRFGSPGAAGDSNGKLAGFIQQDFGDAIDAGLLAFDNDTPLDPSDDLYFDLASSGPTLTSVSEALAGALPRDTEVQEVPAETPLSMTELRLLRELSIYAQRPDPEEYLSNARIGVALYDDNDTLFAEIPEVTVNRLLNDRVREVLDGFRQLVFLTDEEAAAAGTDDRRVLIREQLTEARLEFALAASRGGESSPEAFYQFMATGQYAPVVQFLGQLNELLTSVANLGLTDREFRTARRLTLEQIKPDNIPLDELERLLELSSGIAQSPEIVPLDDPATESVNVSFGR